MGDNGKKVEPQYGEYRNRIGTQFDDIMQQLDAMSAELENACVINNDGKYDRNTIESVLQKIDDFINQSPEIRTARIEGKPDVQNIVNYINLDVLQKLNDLQEKVTDSEQSEIDEVKERYNSNRTNTIQTNLQRFKNELKPLSSEEREVAARRKELELSEKISIIKALKSDKKNKKSKRTKTNDGDIREKIDEINVSLNEIRNRISTQNALKNPEIRQELTELYSGIAEKINGNQSLTQEDIDNLKKLLRRLKPFTVVPQIESIIDTIYEPDSKETFKQRISKAMNENPRIEWGNIDEIDANLTNRSNEQLKTLLTTSSMFKLYTDDRIFPENKGKVQAWLEQLNGENPNLDDIVNEIEEEKIISKLFERIDTIDLDTLIQEHEKVGEITRKLIALNKKQVTTATRKIFGKHLEIKGENGKPLDIAEIEVTPENIELLYKSLTEQSTEVDIEDMNKEFMDSIPEEEKKPSFLKKVAWKVFHPKSWGDGNGLSSYMVNKRNLWIKEKIQKEVKEMQSEIVKTKNSNPKDSWTLAPEVLEQIRANDRQRLAQANALGIEAIIDGETLDAAREKARKKFEQEQEQADFSLDL